MRKKNLLAAAAVMALVLGSLTGCGSSADIGRNAAKETALNDAGISEADTTRMSVTEDRDDGKKIYDIKFNAGGKEYDYEVQASDGRILSSEVDTDTCYTAGSEDPGLGSALVPGDSSQNSQGQNSGSGDGSTSGTASNGQTQDSGQSQNSGAAGNTNSSVGSQGTGQNSKGSSNSSSDSGVALSIDDAIGIALGRVPGATEQNMKIELERDDGRYKYEGEIHYNGREYEFEIDANSGTILEWSEERD